MATVPASAPEQYSARPAWQQVRVLLSEELKPTPGRMKAALVRVAAVVLAMWAGYALNVPEISAVVSLAFFAAAIDWDECKKVALGVPFSVLVILLILTLLLSVFGTTPLVRTLAFIIIIFTSLYLLQAAREGQIFLLAAVFGKLFLELWDSGYTASLTQELSLWIVAELALAGICALAVCALFGRRAQNPAEEFRATLESRFELVADFLATSYPVENCAAELRTEIASTEGKLLKLLDSASKKDTTLKSHRALFVDLVRINQLLLHECIILHMHFGEYWQHASEGLRWCSNRCHAIAKVVRSGGQLGVRSEAMRLNEDGLLRLLTDTIELAEGVASGRTALPGRTDEKKKTFLRADALTNPLYLRNASRAFAAVFACYCLISGAMWSGIGTAVTTCLITALTTVQQSRQKQTLRIAGAAAGGIVTLLVVIFIIPTGVGLAGLSIVTALVVFVGAWIFAGGPNLNYAGVQLVLCYFLGVFGEGKTPTSLISVRDRVIGIFVGNLAMWLFYDRIRPAWTKDRSRCKFADEVDSIAQLIRGQRLCQQSWRLNRLIVREREAFATAQAALKAMSETASPSILPWSKAQQRDAPQIRFAEMRLSNLFSVAFVEAASHLLRLPTIDHPDDADDLSNSLFNLASKLRNGEQIEHNTTNSSLSTAFTPQALFGSAQNALASLFSTRT